MRATSSPSLTQALCSPRRYASRTTSVLITAIGTNTVPYQPIEEDYGITRNVLKVLSAFKYPVGIATKGARVTPDLNLLADLASRNLAHVMLFVTTLASPGAQDGAMGVNAATVAGGHPTAQQCRYSHGYHGGTH